MSNAEKTSLGQSIEDPQYHLDETNELRYYMDVNNMIVCGPDHHDPDVDDPFGGDLHFLHEGNTGDDDDRVDEDEIQSAVTEHITDIQSNGNEDRRSVIPTIDKYDCVAHFHRFFRLKFVNVAGNMSNVMETHCKWNEDPQYHHRDQMNDEVIINNLNETQSDIAAHTSILQNKSDIRNIARPQVEGFHTDKIDKCYDEACAKPDMERTEYENTDC